jgi:catechol 2,3-dioxygenase-like lactoylglutathione lyase family enzyme
VTRAADSRVADSPLAARRVAGVSLTSAEADALAEFYVALGFERAAREPGGGPACAHLAEPAHAQARVVLLRLGAEWLELVTFARAGRPYPRGAASNDPWFQHFAIVVASMQAAYGRLARLKGWTPITQPAPQRLPESSGAVTAFKFRDPEGHPLELLEFPADRMPLLWRARSEEASPFLGIDHSAIVVASTERSLEFYERRLGFARTGGSRNRGPEQAHLDGLTAPDVEVTALEAALREPPHLELLCYRAPSGRPALSPPLESCDIAATRLLIEIDGGSQPALGAGESGASSGLAGALTHDPDGHALRLVPRG